MNVTSTRRFGAALVFSSLTWSGLACAADARATAPAVAAAPAAAAATPPRHGARSKATDGTLVLYDAVAGVWRVPSLKDAFWVGERFHRNENGVWLTAAASAGPWTVEATQAVPDTVKGSYTAPKTQVTAKLPSGRDAVYEPRLKVYKVADRKGVFLFDGLFYRYDSGLWLQAKSEDGPWVPGAAKPLPQVLRKAVPVAEGGQVVKLPSGENVVYDADLRVFTLEAKPETVLFEGAFYERHGEQWVTSATPSGAFEDTDTGSVPAPVRIKLKKADGDAKPKGDHAKADKPKKPKGEAGAAKVEAGAATGEAATATGEAGTRRKGGAGKGDGAKKGGAGKHAGAGAKAAAGEGKKTTATNEDDE